MRRILFFALGITALLISHDACADIYKWTDKDGTVNYTDTPPATGQNYEKIRSEIPKSSPPTIRTEIPPPKTSIDRNYPKKYKVKKEVPKNNKVEDINNNPNSEAEKQLMAMANSLLPSDSKLSDKAKGYVVLMLIDGMLPFDLKTILKNVKHDEDMGEILEYMSVSRKKKFGDIIGNTNSVYESPESTWGKYKSALMNGDLESALDCLTPKLAYKQREEFKLLTRSDIINYGNKLNPISKIVVEGNGAEYRMYYNVNGKSMTNYVYFIRLNENWKIKQY